MVKSRISRYPIICYNGQYRTDGEGNPKVYMLYGHVHNTYGRILVLIGIVVKFIKVIEEKD